MPKMPERNTMIKVLTGKNIFLLNEYKFKIINDYLKEFGDFGIEKFDASNITFNELQGNIQSIPFLSLKKLIILNDLINSKDISDNIEKIFDYDNDQIELVIIESNLDKRSLLYKNLKAKTNLIEFNELDEYSLVNWVIEVAKDKLIDISRNDAAYLVKRIGTNQQKIYNELLKLSDFDKKISKENINLLTKQSINSTTFDMLDCVFEGDINRAVQYYQEQRLLGVEPQMIIGSLVWQLRVLLALKYANTSDINQVAKLSKFSPYSLRKSQKLADNISKQQLKGIIHEILILDIDSKSRNLDIDQAILNKLLTISSIGKS